MSRVCTIWTDEEIEILDTMYETGCDIDEISNVLRRYPLGIAYRLMARGYILELAEARGWRGEDYRPEHIVKLHEARMEARRQQCENEQRARYERRAARKEQLEIERQQRCALMEQHRVLMEQHKFESRVLEIESVLQPCASKVSVTPRRRRRSYKPRKRHRRS
jgi:hypothetical protein